MHDEDSNPILNSIALSIQAKGGIVDVYREGRGVLGSFKSIKQASGSMDYSVLPPRRRLPLPEFWNVTYGRLEGGYTGCEVIIKSAYEKLEVRKIKPNVYHVIIPA